MESTAVTFESIARLPAPADNVAIATRRLEAGTTVALPGGPRRLAHTVLEGHRFAVQPIPAGEVLLSWGLPFGTALSEISAGDYVSNQAMIEALALRTLERVSLPSAPNFADFLETFHFDENTFHPAPPTRPGPDANAATPPGPRTFLGHRRPGGRGVGTRNFIVVLGTTSQTASFARQLAARLQPLARVHPGIDGIVAVAHTEGGGPGEPNNTTEVLRALAGFMVHPNVGAVLAVDGGVEPITNERLRAFLDQHAYPLEHVPHAFLTLSSGLGAGMAEGERIIRDWLPVVAAEKRTPESLSNLRIALQCGGSDAFSGVSGNPLAGAIVHEVIRHGGTGVLTETDEVVGAEGYLLSRICDAPTARAFLGQIEVFRERLGWHGVTAESNPSGGNRLRGLYNITLKSLGAVHKKDPRTRLDAVINYAEPLTEPGFYFMNGPGNDLESIAGEVAGGCNLIIFVTGNGSITNFPFVPTLKITTTTRRHQLLIHEMDINAGRYLDGESMETLCAESLDLVIATASGRLSRGEHAGHSQVSIWRDWRQTDASRLGELRQRPAPDGMPLPLRPAIRRKTNLANSAPGSGGSASVQAVDEKEVVPPEGAPTSAGSFGRTETNARPATERVGLILPTSLCAGQVARLAAERLTARAIGRTQGISRFVALVHTEGCGFGGDSMYRLLLRTYQGYLTHPNVAAALLLEHGCEKIPNDVMRHHLESAGIATSRFGWSSVQLDGGIEKALDRIETWFAECFAALPPPAAEAAALGDLTLGLMAAPPVASATATTLARIARTMTADGGSVLLPESDPLLANEFFRAGTIGAIPPHATLAYGQPIIHPGFHVVATETDHWVENLTGLGGCGAHLVLALIRDRTQPGHPLIPVIQVAAPSERGLLPDDELDLRLTGDPNVDENELIGIIRAIAHKDRIPAVNAHGLVDFQLTRGLLGVST